MTRPNFTHISTGRSSEDLFTLNKNRTKEELFQERMWMLFLKLNSSLYITTLRCSGWLPGCCYVLTRCSKWSLGQRSSTSALGHYGWLICSCCVFTADFHQMPQNLEYFCSLSSIMKSITFLLQSWRTWDIPAVLQSWSSDHQHLNFHRRHTRN